MRATRLSPAGSEGTRISGITGDQEPTRWLRRRSLHALAHVGQRQDFPSTGARTSSLREGRSGSKARAEAFSRYFVGGLQPPIPLFRVPWSPVISVEVGPFLAVGDRRSVQNPHLGQLTIKACADVWILATNGLGKLPEDSLRPLRSEQPGLSESDEEITERDWEEDAGVVDDGEGHSV